MRLSLGLLIVLPLAAHADPKLGADAHRKYGEQMQRGHAFQKAKNYRSAIEVFQKALEAVPDDPTALGELGWTQYLAGDLDAAAASTKRAAASDGAPGVKGAALYNLGLIAEARHDTAGAVAAYAQSLKVRPNSTVRAALAKLDKAAAAALDPFGATPLHATKALDCGTSADGTCSCEAKVLAKNAAGFELIESLDSECHDPPGAIRGSGFHRLAVQRGGAWFVTDPVGDDDYRMFCSNAGSKLAAEARGKRVVVAITNAGSCENGDDSSNWDLRSLVVIGLHAGAPVATPSLAIARREWRSTNGVDKPATAAIALEPTWNADGSVTLAGKTTGLDKSEAANLLGRHELGLD